MRLLDKLHSGGVYTIAELSVNHAGSLDLALDAVRLAAKAGADCLKTQYFTGDSITLNSDSGPFRMEGQYHSLYEFYEAVKMPVEWQPRIKAECEKNGIDFLCTPTDAATADYLDELGMEFFKVAAFELPDYPLLRHLGSKKKLVVLSCGMASVEEIEGAIAALRESGCPEIVLLKCTSEYPAPFEELNLSLIPDMKQRFGLPVGFSDHTPGPFAPPLAVILGARVIEKHFCVGRTPITAESHFSMTPDEFEEMVKNCNLALKAVGTGTYELTRAEKAAMGSRRSLFACKPIQKGELFTAENVKSARPSCGLSPQYYDGLIGKRAACDIPYAAPLSLEMIEK